MSAFAIVADVELEREYCLIYRKKKFKIKNVLLKILFQKLLLIIINKDIIDIITMNTFIIWLIIMEQAYKHC